MTSEDKTSTIEVTVTVTLTYQVKHPDSYPGMTLEQAINYEVHGRDKYDQLTNFIESIELEDALVSIQSSARVVDE